MFEKSANNSPNTLFRKNFCLGIKKAEFYAAKKDYVKMLSTKKRRKCAAFPFLLIVAAWRAPFLNIWFPLSKYLGPHFHCLTAELGIVNMSMRGNNGQSFELRMHLFFFYTRKHYRLLKASRSQAWQRWDPPIDGSRLNTDSTWQFYIIMISYNSLFNTCHVITWALTTIQNICHNLSLTTVKNICANKPRSLLILHVKLMNIWHTTQII